MLYFGALNKIGAVVQLINPNYLKVNGKNYIDDTNTKLLICMDRFYPVIKDSIKDTNVNKILLSSMYEYSSLLYKLIIKRQKIRDEDKIDGKEYLELPNFIKLGEKSRLNIKLIIYYYQTYFLYFAKNGHSNKI